MKKFLALLTFLLFLLLVWMSWNWYKTNIACCPEAPVEEVVTLGPLVYDCATGNPETNENWERRKSDILSASAEGKKLLIVGPYFEGESKEAGIERANKVKQLFHNDLDIDQFEFDAIQINSDCATAIKNDLHNTLFKWVTRNEHVIEHHDKTYIYFKYDTTNPIDTENVVKYLNDLVAYLESSGGSIHVTGHTDADGDENYNYELGLKRANRVKDYLMSKGVEDSQIKVDSKGKTQPLSDNTSPEGKQRNRRVELVVD